jgi:FkbM family methyltransferase
MSPEPNNPRKVAVAARIRAMLARWVWLSRLVGSPVDALRLILAMKRDGVAVQVAHAGKRLVHFRAKDQQALREVLVDREYAFLRQIADLEGPVILDIGAHIGTFAIWCLQANSDCRILSVEADPQTAEIARMNAQHEPNWQIVEAAAAANNGEALSLSVSGASMSSRITRGGKTETSVSVVGRSLAALLDELAGPSGRVDIAKVDIEGSEEAFLCGDPAQLARIDALVVELHPTLCDVEKVEAHLAAAFDRIEAIGGRISTKPLLYCRRQKAVPQ